MKYLKIPVEIIQYCFKNKLIPQLRLWCYYKITYPTGYFENSSDVAAGTMKRLNIKSRKTLAVHNKKLISWNWVGYDTVGRKYFIRSYARLKLMVGSRSRLCILLYPEDLDQFRVWCAAVITGSLLISRKIQLSMNKERGKRGRIKAGPNPSLPLSNSIIAKALDVTPKQASIYKNAAVNAKLLGIERNQFESMDIIPSRLKELRLYDSYEARKMHIRGNRVYKRLPDNLFIRELEFMRSPKSTKSKKGKHI